MCVMLWQTFLLLLTILLLLSTASSLSTYFSSSPPIPPCDGAKFVFRNTLTTTTTTAPKSNVSDKDIGDNNDQDITTVIGSCNQWKIPNPDDEDEVEMMYPTARSIFTFNGDDSMQVPIRTTSFSCGKLGYEVWSSSIALAIYCHAELATLAAATTTRTDTLNDDDDASSSSSSSTSTTTILELGAGCGFPSSVLARHKTAGGLEVISTDFWSEPDDAFDPDRLIPEVWHGMNLKYNVESPDNCNPARAERLDWFHPSTISDGPIDWVIGSDLVYYPQDLKLLWTTLESFLERGSKILIVAPNSTKREALPQFIELLEEKQQSGYLKLEMEEWNLYQGNVDVKEELGGEVSKYLKFYFEKAAAK